jgi:hypothetical protein
VARADWAGTGRRSRPELLPTITRVGPALPEHPPSTSAPRRVPRGVPASPGRAMAGRSSPPAWRVPRLRGGRPGRPAVGWPSRTGAESDSTTAARLRGRCRW